MSMLFWVTGFALWSLLFLILVSKVVKRFLVKPEIDMRDKVIAITGCDSGFGYGLMTRLVGKGAKVIALTYTEEGAKQALEQGAYHSIVCDLGNRAQQDQAVDSILDAAQNRLWGMVHCAGVVLPGFIEYQPQHFYDISLEVNFSSIVRLNQKLLPSLRKNKGRICMVSSVDGLVSLPGNAPYDAAKFALEGYADALRVELSYWNVDVSVINPATMKTPLAMGFFEAHRHTWQTYQQQNPQGDWQTLFSEDWLNRYIATNTPQLERIAQNPELAIRDLEHAVCANTPKHRYLSGRLAKTLFRALWIMPETWSFKFKQKMVVPPPNS